MSKKSFSMMLILTMMMTMFIGTGTAFAAAIFISLSIPKVEADGGTHDLGSVKIQLEDVTALPADGAWLTIGLPQGCIFDSKYTEDEVIVNDNLVVDKIIQTALNTMEILIIPRYIDGEPHGEIIIHFNDIIVYSGSGDIVAKFLSNCSAFGVLNTAIIGNISQGGSSIIPVPAAVFSSLTIPNIKADGGIHNMGSVIIQLEDVRVLPADGAWLTISLPSGCTFESEYTADEVIANHNLVVDKILQTGPDTMEILIIPNYSSGDASGNIIIHFNDVIVDLGFGDIFVDFSSNNSTFGTLNSVIIGNISQGRTNVLSKSVKTISAAGGEIDTLIIAEKAPGSFKPGEVITVKLPEGFTWDYGADAEGKLYMYTTDEIINQFRHISGVWSLDGAAFDFDGIGQSPS